MIYHGLNKRFIFTHYCDSGQIDNHHGHKYM
jgi:hypothetical protein